MTTGRISALLISGSILALAGAARADVEISSKATSNMDCEAGVCTASAQKAVLNTGDLQTMLSSGDVAVRTGSLAKDIDINQPVTWASSSRLTLDAQRSVIWKKPVTVTGVGALTITTNDGGGGGDLLFEDKGSIAFSDTSSSLLINGQSFTLVQDITTLGTDIATNPSGAYALADSYDAGHDRFDKLPVPMPFSGTFEGLGQTISHLKLKRNIKCGIEHGSGSRCEGFFASVTGTGFVRDLLLRKISVLSSGADYAGALVGLNYGTVRNIYVDGGVTGTAAYIGGMIGGNNGEISNSVSAVDVAATGASIAGGLVGSSMNLITGSHSSGSVTATTAGGLGGTAAGVLNSYATGAVSGSSLAGGLLAGGSQVTQSYATGSVTGTHTRAKIGGLVGNGEDITNCYATGSVDAMESSDIGGLAGEGRAISDSYSTGALIVEGTSNAGGFVGRTFGRESSDDYWDIETSGISQGCGRGNCAYASGLTTAQLQAGLPTGFNPKVWASDPNINNGFPYLRATPPE